jgi:YVTN family beta-propeller protein
MRSRIGHWRLLAGLVWAAAAGTVPALAAADAEPLYRLGGSVLLGPPERWDYLHYDAASQRIFIAHATEIDVVDGRRAVLLGRLGGIGGAHGVDLGLGKGFAVNGDRGSVTVFDPATLQPQQEVKADADADALVYDPASRRVFVVNGDAHDISVIDAASASFIANIPLGGAPEFAAADGAGKLYVNIKDTSQIVRIDTAGARIDARWPIADCKAPHGLAIDSASRRVFSSCVNSRLMVVDADDGRVVAELPIGKGSDAAAFDPVRKRIFSSNGEGTISVIAEQPGDRYAVLGGVPTARGARTMTLDPGSGRLFVVSGEVAKVNPPKEPGRAPRFDYVPGSVKLLYFDPVP